MKSTLKDGGGKNLLFESTIFTGTYFVLCSFSLLSSLIIALNGYISCINSTTITHWEPNRKRKRLFRPNISHLGVT